MRIRKLWILALACAASFSTGCLTKSQVAAIVAESNAALVSPYVNDPTGAQSADWKEAVEQIEKLIVANPDNEVLVHQLRVRQALLYTVNKKPALAEKRWLMSEPDKLKNERDRALRDAYKGVIWAYKSGSLPGFSDTLARQDIEGALEGVESRSTRVFLRMLQASIVLLQADGLDDNQDRMEIQELLDEPIDLFVGEFSASELEWARTNYGGAAPPPEELSLLDIRHGVWLRRIVKEAERLAGDIVSGNPEGDALWPAWSDATLTIMGRPVPVTP